MPDRRFTKIAFGGIFTALLLAFLITPPLLAGPGDKTKPVPAQKAEKKKYNPADYVGADTCKGCHEPVFAKFESTRHWKTMTDSSRGPEWTGCESCHGGGAAHVAGGGDKTKIFNFAEAKSKDVTRQCLECHQYGEEHSNFARSAHNTNDVSCTACHSVHNAKQKEFLLKSSNQTALCYSCHLEVKPDFSRPFRHRVNEGLVKCTDCHNQHGGYLTRQVRSTSAQDTLCFKCHVEKAGPFVFEHRPMKTEGCVSCHVPHGTSNPRMLKRNNVNLLCLECHTLSSDGSGVPLPSFHNQTQKYQACTLCHIAIHGSNTSVVFFK